MHAALDSRPVLTGNDFLSARGLLDGLPYPVLLIGDDFEVRFANHEARRTFGEGTRCHELAHCLDQPCSGDESLCPKLVAQNTGRFTTAQHVHTTTDGKQSVFVCAVPLDNGEVITLHVPTGHDPSRFVRTAAWGGVVFATIALFVLFLGLFVGLFSAFNAVLTIGLGLIALGLSYEALSATRRGLAPQRGQLLRTAAVSMSLLSIGAGASVLLGVLFILLRSLV